MYPIIIIVVKCILHENFMFLDCLSTLNINNNFTDFFGSFPNYVYNLKIFLSN